MKFVPDARNWWKWHTTYVFGVLGVFPVVWLNSTDLQALLPPSVVSKIAPFVAALGLFLRLRDQMLKVPLPKPTVPPSNDFHQGKDS